MTKVALTYLSRPFYICLYLYLSIGLSSSGPVSLGALNTWFFNGLQAEEVTLLNNKQLKIEKLYFTDQGPAVWFMLGNGDNYKEEFVNLEGFIIPDEDGSCKRLKGYSQDDIILTAPGNLKFTDYDYLSVFCVRFNHNFGYISIPPGLKFDNDTLTEEAKIDPPDTCDQEVEGRVPVDDEDDDDEEEKRK